MLFHLGSLIRLNEAGILVKLKRISSVSGGSITAGVLGMMWESLDFQNGVAQNFQPVIDAVRTIGCKTIDIPAVAKGLFFGTISQWVEAAYDCTLFHGKTLADLPADLKGPRFVINATNLQSGALFRFSKPFMADYLVGMVPSPTVSLAKAVAASSAFPPVLSPCVLKLDPALFKPDPNCPLQKKPYTSKIVLSDGGVYDNMGLETVWKDYQTVLVSDAGQKMPPEESPKHDWLFQTVRVLNVIDNQVRSLRKRQVIEAFETPGDIHDGTYWGIGSHLKDYHLADAFNCSEYRTLELARISTRLKALEPEYQERLINWGYAICDTAIRAHVDKTLPKGTLPFPDTVV